MKRVVTVSISLVLVALMAALVVLPGCGGTGSADTLFVAFVASDSGQGPENLPALALSRRVRLSSKTRR